MAQVKSKQMDSIGGGDKVKTNELHGKKRIMWWDFTTAATDGAGTGPVNAGDTILLGTLPTGSRVTGGRISFGAMGTGADVHIGTAADADRYLATGDVAAAGQLDIANTAALFFGDKLTAETNIIATNPAAGSANWATTSQVFNGYVEYVVD